MIKLKHIPLIEYHLVNHCNLNCKGCAHFAPLAKPWFADINEFEKDLNQLSSKVIIDKLTLFGGEPLLNNDIFNHYYKTKENMFEIKHSLFIKNKLKA